MANRGKMSRNVRVASALELAEDQYVSRRMSRSQSRKFKAPEPTIGAMIVSPYVDTPNIRVKGLAIKQPKQVERAVKVQRKRWNLNSFWNPKTKQYEGLEFITDNEVRHHVMDLLRERNVIFTKTFHALCDQDQELQSLRARDDPQADGNWRVRKRICLIREKHKGDAIGKVRNIPRHRCIQAEVLALLDKYY